jgi:cysteine-rich repeat protein
VFVPGDPGGTGGAGSGEPGGAAGSNGGDPGGSTGAGGSGGYYFYEGCDDGNTDAGDGCDAACNVEPGWVCTAPGVACRQPTCGDGYLDIVFVPGDPLATGGASGEEPGGTGGTTGGEAGGAPGAGGAGGGGYYVYEACDDGNPNAGDGCDASCNVESGFVCPEPGAACRQPTCGDGFQDSVFVPGDPGGTGGSTGEEPGGAGGATSGDPGGAPGSGGAPGGGYYVYEGCDDGNTAASDGCDSTCNVEPGWTCDAPGTPCREPRCGDGIVDWYYPEGSTGAGGAAGTAGAPGGPDGSGGMSAGGAPGSDPVEQCDDGNTAPGDGCSGDCRIE